MYHHVSEDMGTYDQVDVLVVDPCTPIDSTISGEKHVDVLHNLHYLKSMLMMKQVDMRGFETISDSDPDHHSLSVSQVVSGGRSNSCHDSCP